jgi:phosphate transport system protein
MPAQKEQDLENIKEQILKMGSFVEDAIRKSIKALVERDRDLAIAVIDGDAIVNNYDVEIEELCIRFLALWQPTGSNLRFVTTAIKIITDIERIGDMAVDTCERAVEILDEPPLKPYIDIPRMAEAAQKMLKDSLDAFVAKDADLAIRVCESDDFVDNLNQQIFNELLLYMLKDPKNIGRAVRLTYIAKYLERIADHATHRGNGRVHGQGEGHPPHGMRDRAQNAAKLTGQTFPFPCAPAR